MISIKKKNRLNDLIKLPSYKIIEQEIKSFKIQK